MSDYRTGGHLPLFEGRNGVLRNQEPTWRRQWKPCAANCGRLIPVNGDNTNDPYCSKECAQKPLRREVLPTQNAVSQKREGKRERMLARLKAGRASTWDLIQIGGSGFSSRLAELRRDGWKITCEEREDGAVYTLETPRG